MNRAALMEKLKEANIEFPATATMSQLKQLVVHVVEPESFVEASIESVEEQNTGNIGNNNIEDEDDAEIGRLKKRNLSTNYANN